DVGDLAEAARPQREARHLRRDDRADGADLAPAPLHEEPVGPRIDDGAEELVPRDLRARREGRLPAGRRPRDAAVEGRGGPRTPRKPQGDRQDRVDAGELRKETSMKAEDIRIAAVLGAGTMGHGIAQVLAMAGIETRLFDVDASAVERGLSAVRGNLDKGVQKGKVETSARDAALGRLSGVSNLD